MYGTSLAGLPSGLVPRVEKVASQLKVVQGTRAVPWIMIDIDTAERFVRAGQTAREIFPHGRIITTSTIHDRKLVQYHFERELEVMGGFRPAFHIPCDRPVYVEENSEGRAWFIDGMVRSTLSLRDALRGTGVPLLPLVKGVDALEWTRSFAPLAHEGFRGFAFYVKQYFGAGLGRRDLEMVQDVRGVVSTCGMPYLLLVGYQSDARLLDLPPAVKAFAGQRWRSLCRVGKAPPAKSRMLLEELVRSWSVGHGPRQDVLVQGTLVGLAEVG